VSAWATLIRPVHILRAFRPPAAHSARREILEHTGGFEETWGLYEEQVSYVKVCFRG